MKIGLLVIATNKYIQFVEPLYNSMKKNFLPGHEVTMYVFTDKPTIPQVVRIEQEHMKWPGPTLLRFSIFSKNREIFKHNEYLFYCDVDMLFNGLVGDEVLSDFSATLHPAFNHKIRTMYTYEENPSSTAYIPKTKGINYYAGGFYGGTTQNFLNMCETIKTNIETDLSNKIIAIWHDESHFNKYLIDNPPANILSSSYCFPDSDHKASVWGINHLPRKLLALEKNHEEIRS